MTERGSNLVRTEGTLHVGEDGTWEFRPASIAGFTTMEEEIIEKVLESGAELFKPGTHHFTIELRW